MDFIHIPTKLGKPVTECIKEAAQPVNHGADTRAKRYFQFHEPTFLPVGKLPQEVKGQPVGKFVVFFNFPAKEKSKGYSKERSAVRRGGGQEVCQMWGFFPERCRRVRDSPVGRDGHL